MCFFKENWSSKITARFLTELDGVIVDEYTVPSTNIGTLGKYEHNYTNM